MKNLSTIFLRYFYAENPSLEFTKQQIENIQKKVHSQIRADKLSPTPSPDADVFEECNALLTLLLTTINNESKKTLQQLLEDSVPGVGKDMFHLMHGNVILNRKNIGLTRLYLQMKKMYEYGEKIGFEKGKMIKAHVCFLESKLVDFLFKDSITPEDEKRFKAEFIRELHSRDTEMSAHRKAWKPILLNIVIAFTGIGLVALIAKGICNAKDESEFSLNKLGFFGSTRSQELVKHAERLSAQWSVIS